MRSKVYFISVGERDAVKIIKVKFLKLLEASKLLRLVNKHDKAIVKIHFGEEENTGYVKPEYMRLLCEEIIKKKAIPFLTDTNTLYKGRRTDSHDHIKLSEEHGFTKKSVLADIVVPDETDPENVSTVNINQQFVKEAKIISLFLESDILIGVSHFKGHMMTGFGGALKNIGMGCASRCGKLEQHSDLSPFVMKNKCINCGSCIKVCPSDAISIVNEKAYIDRLKCIGCAVCIAVCKETAIDVNWESGADTIQEKMIEYTKAVLDTKKGKSFFINFAVKITKECDCLAKDDPRISSDVGILISEDPVSLDKASLDLVNKACNKDIFKEVHPDRNGFKQLEYAEKLKLGNLEYELVEV